MQQAARGCLAASIGRGNFYSAVLLAGAALLFSGALPAQQAAPSANATQTTVADAPLSPDVIAKVSAGQFAAAEADLRAQLQSAPSSPKANFLLGYVLFRERRYSDSLAAYTAGAKSATPEPDDILVVASDYIQLRSYADAARWLSYVTEHEPQNERAWYLLGRTSYQLDHPDEALRAFEQCLRLKPRNLPAKYNAGLALERLQRPADAEIAYREAIRWATEDHIPDPQPWLNLGNLLLSQRKFPEAVEALSTAAQRAPANPLCQQQLGVALEASGKFPEALVPLHEAVKLAPDAERAHFYLARTLKELGRKQESDAEFAIVARLHSSRAGTETPNPDTATPHSFGRETSN